MSEATSDAPVLDLLASMTADSIAASSLDVQTLALVRIAALAAVDAPPVSYLLNLELQARSESTPSRSAVCSPRSPRSSARPESPPPQARSSMRSTSRSMSQTSLRKARSNRAGRKPPLIGRRRHRAYSSDRASEMTWASRFRVRQSLAESLWVIPLLGAVLGGFLGIGVSLADEQIGTLAMWQYTPSTASTFLSAIVGATAALTGFVVTVTVLVIQMATGTSRPASCASYTATGC